MEADGGTLEIDSTSVTDTDELPATDNSTLVLNDDTITNDAIVDHHTVNGTVQVDDGSTLDLESATISGGNVTIEGTLDSTGTSSITDATITNGGTIDATSGTLTIDSSHTITNSGTLEATSGGRLNIDDSVNNNSSGSIDAASGGTVDITEPISGGNITVDGGGTLTFGGTSDVNTTVHATFDNGASDKGASYGTLVFDDASDLTAFITGFAGQSSTDSDVIDLTGIDPHDVTYKTYKVDDKTVITIEDGSNSSTITLVDYTGSLDITSDGHGGTSIADPTTTSSSSTSVSTGGPGNDTFIFKPGIGADTTANFNPQHDTIELNNFSSIHSYQQLESLITTDTHGDAVIELGHNDSITHLHTLALLH